MYVPRFLKEYANFQKNSFLHNELIKEEFKKLATERIDKAAFATERGTITVNEAIRIINNPFDGILQKEGD